MGAGRWACSCAIECREGGFWSLGIACGRMGGNWFIMGMGSLILLGMLGVCGSRIAAGGLDQFL